MIILVEGPDNTGKSTLCEKICLKYGFEYIHSERADDIEKQGQEVLKQLRESKEKGISVMVDRAHISNTIYSDVFNDTAYLSEDLYNNLDGIMDKTVICIPKDKEEYLNRYMKEKEIREDLYDDMSSVYDLYKRYAKEHEVILYDWTAVTEEQTDEFIDNLIKE